MSKRAVILAGGKGTRLKPYTVVLPKPLVPIGDYPILEVVLRQLVRHGFDHLTIAVNYQAEIIKAFFGDGSRWGIDIDYSLEDRPLSTMGPLKLIKDLPENFLIMNGDVLTDLDYTEFYNYHLKSNNTFTVAGYRRKDKSEYGVLEIDEDGWLCGFKEKPAIVHKVSMGIYAANRKILKHIPKDRPYGFNHLMLDLIKSKTPANVKMHDGFWLDIGRQDDYAQAIEIFEKKKRLFLKDEA